MAPAAGVGPGLGPRARVLEPLPVSDLLLPLLCPPRLLLPTTTTPRTCLTTSDQCWLVANSRYSSATRRAPSSPPRASAARARRSTCRRSPSSPSLLGGPEKAQAGLHVSRLAAQPRGLGSSLSDRSPRSAPQRAGIPGRSTQTRTRACGPSAAATQRTYTRLGSARLTPTRLAVPPPRQAAAARQKKRSVSGERSRSSSSTWAVAGKALGRLVEGSSSVFLDHHGVRVAATRRRSAQHRLRHRPLRAQVTAATSRGQGREGPGREGPGREGQGREGPGREGRLQRRLEVARDLGVAGA